MHAKRIEEVTSPKAAKPVILQVPTKPIKQVEFKLDAPQALAVFLAGEFNNWDPTRAPLKRDRQGIWKTTVPLAPGRHQYRFVVDGQWQSDPKAKVSVSNQFGSENSIAVV